MSTLSLTQWPSQSAAPTGWPSQDSSTVPWSLWSGRGWTGKGILKRGMMQFFKPDGCPVDPFPGTLLQYSPHWQALVWQLQCFSASPSEIHFSTFEQLNQLSHNLWFGYCQFSNSDDEWGILCGWKLPQKLVDAWSDDSHPALVKIVKSLGS